MSDYDPDRKLAGPEVDLIVHLLRAGGAAMPLKLLPGAARVATPLWRLGVVNIWYRQSVMSARPEGPFYSLTRIGSFRAESLYTARARLSASLNRKAFVTESDQQSNPLEGNHEDP
jgi:hypothetical protein